MTKELLRKLPKIDEILKLDKCNELILKYKRNRVVNELRSSIDYYRKKIIEGELKESPSIEEIIEKCKSILNKQNKNLLRRVVNATGVVIHTNLGRSILSKESTKALANIATYYNNTEYNLETGKRGSRYSHIEEIITELTGAESAIVVNNNAAAIMLVLNSLCQNKEVIVSRGQLVEIGGSFRIPEVMNFSGAKLVEIGTTNRTHLCDYEKAITDNTSALLKVHSSNFKIIGFTKEVELADLVKLGRKNSIPIIEDIGSGLLIDVSKYGLDKEPTVLESIKSGVDIVTFSGDKMLGGPQAGIIVGKKKYIDEIKKNQLIRALRVDKFTLAALEVTLKHYLYNEARDKIPTIKMMTMDEKELKNKSNDLYKKLSSLKDLYKIHVEPGESEVGGGSMPNSKLNTFLIKISSDNITEEFLEEKLRKNNIPIICRIHKGEICIDVRTLLDEDYDIIFNALKEIGDNI